MNKELIQANTKHTPGPLAWQKFGNSWCLTGQYGMRPIVLTASRGQLQLRDSKFDLLIPFDPKHPDAVLLACATDLLKELKRLAALVRDQKACVADADTSFAIIAKAECRYIPS